MSAQNSRKRAAPGAVPAATAQQQQQQQQTYGTNDQLTRWNPNGDGNDFFDTFNNGVGDFDFGAQPVETMPTMSNSLTRRQTNQALVPANPRANFNAVEQWSGYGDAHEGEQEGGDEMLNIDVLEQMAQKAKRDAQAQGNRKGIPPFVQKLSR